jgi:hypothetical protein
MKTISKQAARSEHDVFWAEVSPCDHLLQLYTTDDAFLDSLEGFIAGGLKKGDACIVIATVPHRKGLERRLTERGVDLDTARQNDLYITLDAHATLSKFTVDGWPDDEKFYEIIGDILRRARGDGRHVRAFGEMVALLWADGHSAATVRLEYLWHNLCQAEAFSLFCAYPKIGFTDDMRGSLNEIRAAHSKLIGREPYPDAVF